MCEKLSYFVLVQPLGFNVLEAKGNGWKRSQQTNKQNVCNLGWAYSTYLISLTLLLFKMFNHLHNLLNVLNHVLKPDYELKPKM